MCGALDKTFGKPDSRFSSFHLTKVWENQIQGFPGTNLTTQLNSKGVGGKTWNQSHSESLEPNHKGMLAVCPSHLASFMAPELVWRDTRSGGVVLPCSPTLPPFFSPLCSIVCIGVPRVNVSLQLAWFGRNSSHIGCNYGTSPRCVFLDRNQMVVTYSLILPYFFPPRLSASPPVQPPDELLSNSILRSDDSK